GENFYGPRQLFHAIQAGAGDCVMPDLMRIGGVTGWLRAAAIAGAAGIPMSTHLYPEIAAHLMRVTETAHWLEWQDWADPILRERLERVLEDAHAVAAPVRLFLEQAGAIERPLLQGQLRSGAHLRLEFLEERKGLDEELMDALASFGRVGDEAAHRLQRGVDH